MKKPWAMWDGYHMTIDPVDKQRLERASIYLYEALEDLLEASGGGCDSQQYLKRQEAAESALNRAFPERNQ